MIVEVNNESVLDDPLIIARRKQMDGTDAGFNKYWKDWDDIDNMLYAAEAYLQSSKNPKSTFLVVAGNKVLGKFNNLNAAKEALKQYPSNDAKPSRMVIEVKNNRVLDDPRFIASQNQEIGLPAGCNRRWTGWPDIDRGQDYLDGPGKGKIFIVVVGDRGLGHCRDINEAKQQLLKYPRNSELLRCIFEAMNVRLDPNLRFIGGEEQTGYKRDSFKSYWKSPKVRAAHVYLVFIFPNAPPLRSWAPSPIPSSSPKPRDATGKFIVVVNDKVIEGIYTKLSQAKKVLIRYPTADRPPRRLVGHSRNGECGAAVR